MEDRALQYETVKVYESSLISPEHKTGLKKTKTLRNVDYPENCCTPNCFQFNYLCVKMD